MKRSRFTLSLVSVVSVMLLVASPLPVASAADILGRHVVQPGETLYCLGRGYGVLPSAISSANSLSAFAHLSIGQVLDIPAVPWMRIPAGPVCAPQFVSPYSSVTVVTPAPATNTPPASSSAFYVVQRGDTLWRLGLRYGVTVYSLKVANGLQSNLIYVGQVLVIPGGEDITTGLSCDPAYPTICIPPKPPDLDCPQIQYSDFTVLPPDPHGLDGDVDGIGCESDASSSTSDNFQHLVNLTSPVNAGANATITVLTLAGSTCSIVVTYKSGPSTAQGLDSKLATSNGICSWTWLVGTNTTPGTLTIVVTTGDIRRTYDFVVQ